VALTESQERRIQTVRGAVIAVACWLAIAVLHAVGAFSTFDLKLLDWRFRLRGERPAMDQIALVGVDDATVRAYGAWPLPRDAYALLITALAEGGARAIGVDLQFPDDANQLAASNRLLAHVAGSHSNVVSSIWFQAHGAEPRDPARRSPQTELALSRHGVPAGDLDLASAESISLPYDDLVLKSSSLGHISVAVDPDGAIRRLPLVVRHGDYAYPALVLNLMGQSRGEVRIQGVRAARGGLAFRWPRGHELFVPTDDAGTTGIDFAGDRGSFRNSYSMVEVLRWYRAGDRERIRGAFSGRLVLVGLTSRGEVSEDVGTTPFSTATPLLYVHANALDNLIRGRFLTRISDPLHVAFLAGIAVLLATLSMTLPLPVAAMLTAGTMVALAGLGVALLALWGVDAPLVPALVLAPLVYSATASYRQLFQQSRSRQREADIREGLGVQQRFLPEALVGRKLSRYVIDAKIGAGGMGVVYRGHDPRLGREVAVKVLQGGSLADETMRRRFRREAIALSKFSHRYAAGIYDFDTQDGADFIVMEYVPGQSVEELLRRGPIPEPEAIRIALEITEALGEAHACGIIHRDIKPSNVVLAAKGHAKLLDFGVAQLAFPSEGPPTQGRTLTRAGELIGTLAYMAPEVLAGKRADARSDLYAVGALLFEMTTGSRPFADDQPLELMYIIQNQPPPRPCVLTGRLTAEIETVILRALEKLPDDRYDSAAAMFAALRSLEVRGADPVDDDGSSAMPDEASEMK